MPPQWEALIKNDLRKLLCIYPYCPWRQPISVTAAAHESRPMNERGRWNGPAPVEIHHSSFLASSPVVAFFPDKLGDIPCSRQGFVLYRVRIRRGISRTRRF